MVDVVEDKRKERARNGFFWNKNQFNHFAVQRSWIGSCKSFLVEKENISIEVSLKPKPSPGSPGCQLGGQERQIGALRGSSRVPGAQPIVVHNDQWNTVDKV